VRRLAPTLGARALHVLHLRDRLFQIAQTRAGLGLLQPQVARHALRGPIAAQARQHPVRSGHGARIGRRAGGGEALDFIEQAHLQMRPLAHRLALIVALLPALQAVLGRALHALRARRHGFQGRIRAQALLEFSEHGGNVIVELRARERREGAELRIGIESRRPVA